MGKRLGRPTKPPEYQLSEIVPVRMTPSERQECERAAERAGKRLTAWMRDKAVRAARRG